MVRDPETKRRSNHTKRLVAPCIVATLLVVFPLSSPVGASEALKEQILADLDRIEEKMVGLAEAIPAASFSWTPQEGVRTVSRAFMHVANANFFLPTLLEIELPATARRNLEAITDKAECVAILKASYAHARGAIEKIDAARYTEPKDLFGQPSTVMGVWWQLITHNHEHLGQGIAYARSVGVAPPWSGG